jgi:succinate dehydrogenase flavin-adding protein (antitoxin of CptAB toxin-antitoxin module)
LFKLIWFDLGENGCLYFLYFSSFYHYKVDQKNEKNIQRELEMITYKVLNEQNHRITELTNVLSYLFKDRSMCDTDSCCKIFSNYVQQVKEHIETVDKNMYAALLASPDKNINNVARNFISGSVEVKKILNNYIRQ